jgi:nucleolar complex protein 3
LNFFLDKVRLTNLLIPTSNDNSAIGEALNIDLHDFINHLYALILPMSLDPDIETVRQGAERSAAFPHSTADLFFRALTLAFPMRSSMISSPVRTAAFVKRILIASLCFPSATTIRALEFVRGLLVREPKLQALLTTEDRTADGIYRPELDDPQLSNPFGTSLWELAHLAESHWDPRVKESALELAQFNAS